MIRRVSVIVLLISALFVTPALAYTVYITNHGESSISIIDGTTKKVLDTVKISQANPHLADLSKDGKWLYTSNVGSASVSVLDTAARKEVAVIPTGKGTHGVTLSFDGGYLW